MKIYARTLPHLLAAWLAMCGAANVLVACSSEDGPEAPTQTQDEATDSASASGVALRSDEVAKAGIRTSSAETASYLAQAHGFAVVLTHDLIAQSVSDVITAAAAEQQSKAALAR